MINPTVRVLLVRRLPPQWIGHVAQPLLPLHGPGQLSVGEILSDEGQDSTHATRLPGCTPAALERHPPSSACPLCRSLVSQ